MLNCLILRFDSLGHIYRFYNRIFFSECEDLETVWTQNMNSLKVYIFPTPLVEWQ